MGKPHPEIFLLAARELAVRPGNCFLVEDAVFGIEAAKAGGGRGTARRSGSASEQRGPISSCRIWMKSRSMRSSGSACAPEMPEENWRWVSR
jgi:FMN phosphatase YigB (HAD superfamily)